MAQPLQLELAPKHSRPGLSLSSSGARLRRHAPAVVVLLVGLAVTGWHDARARRTAAAHDARALETQAHLISEEIKLAFHGPLEQLRSLSDLLSTFPALTEADFDAYTGRLLEGHAELASAQWLAAIDAQERERFEHTLGVPITELDAQGRRVPAQSRALYLPLTFAGGAAHGVARGLDLLGPIPDGELLKALDTGTVVAIAQQPGGRATYTIAQAVYEGRPRASRRRGVVALSLHVDQVLGHALSARRTGGLDVAVLDLSAPHGQHLVAGQATLASDDLGGAPGAVSSDTFLADRWFRIVVAPARPEPSGVHGAELWFGVLCSVLAAGLASLAASVLHLRRRVEAARHLGQYVLEQQIGAGAMGVVYRARHALLRRPTAVKLLHTDQLDARGLLRFEHEVQTTAGLSHPNAIAIYDFGHTADGVFYYAMEYLEGIDLQRLVRECGPQPPERVAHLLIQAAGALEEAHAKGLVHRDIKPANLMLCVRGGIPDVLKVLDFGLVKDLRDTRGLEEAAFVGTPFYAAPEAIDAPDRQDGRADLYSLAAVAFFLLTGRELFRGPRVIDVLEQHRSAAPPSLAEAGAAGVPPEFEALLLACLRKRPDERPASATLLRESIERLELAPRWTRSRAQDFWQARSSAIPSALACEEDDIGLGETLTIEVHPGRPAVAS